MSSSLTGSSSPYQFQVPGGGELVGSRLIRTPDFTGVPFIETLCLRGCIKLVEIHSSIGQLSRLNVLNLEFCLSLIELPSNMDGLRSLEILILLGCSKLANLPENLGKIKCLKELDLRGTAISEVPSSISFLICRGCEKQFFKSRLDSVVCFRSLKYLSLSANNLVFTLPASISQLLKLETLNLSNCFRLHSLPELPSNVRYINAKGCSSLEPSPALLSMSNLSQPSISFFNCLKLVEYNESSDGLAFAILKHYLQGLINPKTGYETCKKRNDRSGAAFQIIIPGSEVPQWLTHRRFGINCYGYSSERYSLKGCVMALGDMPRHTFEFFIGEKSSGFRLYLTPNSPSVEVIQCAVRLIYEQDVKEFNETIAQCSSSCVITYEGLDCVDQEFENSAVANATKIKSTCDNYNEAEPSASWSVPEETERCFPLLSAMGKTKDQEKDIKNKQFTWSRPMQCLLLEILATDATEGNKPSDTLMPGSFARATQAISEKFGVECQPNYVENCLRTIKSIWSTITQLRDRKNSFGWDDKLKMITSEKKVYDEEVMAYPDHEQYLNKTIQMYDEMLLVFGKDMATYSSAESFSDIDSEKRIIDLESNDLDIDFEKVSKEKQVSSSNAALSQGRSHRKRSSANCDKFSKQLGKVELAIKRLKKDQL
uniref:Myb/SANT-like domain-containing protein n=1 Tax=Fagus sylvatica TaxID=28930 RepID=A0A2N9J337_FAGSY